MGNTANFLNEAPFVVVSRTIKEGPTRSDPFEGLNRAMGRFYNRLNDPTVEAVALVHNKGAGAPHRQYHARLGFFPEETNDG